MEPEHRELPSSIVEQLNAETPAVKRKRAVKVKKGLVKAKTSKPVVAALVTLGVTVVDLFLNVRYGIKLF